MSMRNKETTAQVRTDLSTTILYYSVRTGEREREHTVFVEHVVALEATSEPIEGLTCFPDPESDGVDRFAKTHSVSGGRQRKFDSAPRGRRMGGGELLERGRSKWRAMERRRIRESGVVASVEVWGQENSFTI